MSLTHSRRRILWLLLLAIISVTCVGATYGQPATPSNSEDLAFWEELAFWEAVKDSSNPEELNAYLEAYPQGRFASLARVRMKALQATASPPPPPPDKGKPDTSEPPAPPTSPTAFDGPVAGELFRDCEDCPQMVVIPPGAFEMGSNRHRSEEKPARTVTIERPFAISVYEITVGEWDACLRSGECQYTPKAGGDQDRLPISNVSWDDAQQYARWLSQKTGAEYRLPSEAEWEYAARAGTTTLFWWGNEAGTAQANCKDCGEPWGGKQAAPVGVFKANPFGLYDVHGNVWEWTMDCWNNSYQGAPADGGSWTRGDCISRVLRGGAWKLEHKYMRSSRRGKYDRDVRYYLNGFRVVKTLP